MPWVTARMALSNENFIFLVFVFINLTRYLNQIKSKANKLKLNLAKTNFILNFKFRNVRKVFKST